MNHFSELRKPSSAEVVCAFYQDQLARLRGRFDDALQLLSWAVAVFAAADEQLRFGALGQELILICPLRDVNRRPNRDERADSFIRIGNRKPSCCPEGETGKDDRQVEFALEPI